jgi:hypothetical protein
MALETCNASANLDVDETTAILAALSLDSFPGENIADSSSTYHQSHENGFHDPK